MIDYNAEMNDAILIVLDMYGEEIKKSLQQQLKQTNKIATGNLYNSIQYEVNISESNASLSIIAADYFQFVDQGVRPGGGLPPIENILAWIRTRNIVPPQNRTTGGRFRKGTRNDRQLNLAWAIAKKIQNEGIVSRVDLRGVVKKKEKDLAMDLAYNVNKRLSLSIGEDLEEIFKRNITVKR